MTDATALDLDRIGRLALGYFDYRIVALLTLALGVLLTVIRQFHSRTRPTLTEFLTGITGLLLVFSGAAVGVILLFTKPPAFDLMPADVLATVGLITTVATFYCGVGQVRAAFFPPKLPIPSAPAVGEDARHAENEEKQ